QDYDIQLQGHFFDINTGESRDCSTGEIGVKVSRKLYNTAGARVPWLSAVQLRKAQQRELGAAKPPVPVSHVAPNARQGRQDARTALLSLQTEALVSHGMERSDRFNLTKLTRPQGFRGLKLVGWSITSQQYKELSLENANEILRLVRSKKIRIESIGEVAEVDEDGEEDGMQEEPVQHDDNHEEAVVSGDSDGQGSVALEGREESGGL
ncbi:hypothetical protein HDU98_005287, partial [Podochytrium sp. JEL0797]